MSYKDYVSNYPNIKIKGSQNLVFYKNKILKSIKNQVEKEYK